MNTKTGSRLGSSGGDGSLRGQSLHTCMWLEVSAATAISAAPRSVRKRGDFPGPLYLPARRRSPRSLANALSPSTTLQREVPDQHARRGSTADMDPSTGITHHEHCTCESECEINTHIGLIPDTASTGSSRKAPAGISRRGAGMSPGEANLSETTYGEFQCYTSGRVPGQLAQARHALRPHLPVSASRAM